MTSSPAGGSTHEQDSNSGVALTAGPHLAGKGKQLERGMDKGRNTWGWLSSGAIRGRGPRPQAMEPGPPAFKPWQVKDEDR